MNRRNRYDFSQHTHTGHISCGISSSWEGPTVHCLLDCCCVCCGWDTCTACHCRSARNGKELMVTVYCIITVLSHDHMTVTWSYMWSHAVTYLTCDHVTVTWSYMWSRDCHMILHVITWLTWSLHVITWHMILHVIAWLMILHMLTWLSHNLSTVWAVWYLVQGQDGWESSKRQWPTWWWGISFPH